MARIDAQQSRALYESCRGPSRRARADAYAQLGRLLHDIAWRRVAGDPRLHHLAEESMQEALEAIWRALEADRGPDAPERFVAWSAMIVVNKLREAIRRLEPKGAAGRTRRVALSRQRSLEAPPRPGELPLADRLQDAEGRDAEDELETKESYARIRDTIGDIAGLDAVSEASRTVLLRGFLEDWDDAALADHLGTTRANVHVIRSRDLAKLRAHPEFMTRLRALYEGDR